MSSESSFAHRAALYYGPELAKKSRQDRIRSVGEELEALNQLEREERRAHEANCPVCQRGDPFCLDSLFITPAQHVRSSRCNFLRTLIHSEERDEAYAQHARISPVEYKHHIDGFCSYWQNLRHRLFVSGDWKCERCGGNGPLEAHHRHYDTLGFEEISDLQALCRKCHQTADHKRGAAARYSNAMQTYLEKKYGEDEECWPHDAEEEFDEWFEQKQEEEC